MSSKLINFEKAVAMAAEIIAPRWDYSYVIPSGEGGTCVNWTPEKVDEGPSWKRVGSCVIGCIIDKFATLDDLSQWASALTTIPAAFPEVTEKALEFFRVLQVKQDQFREDEGRKPWGQCFVESVQEIAARELDDTEAYV